MGFGMVSVEKPCSMNPTTARPEQNGQAKAKEVDGHQAEELVNGLLG
jgi:hypothetical protein